MRRTESLAFGARLASLLAGLASLLSGLAPLLSGCGHPSERAAPSQSAPAVPLTTPSVPKTPSPNAAMRDWEAGARNHFKESAQALQHIWDGSETGDEAAVRSGCEQLHDTNIIGLQQHLPTPDKGLTAELQRMIDDINVATRACLRFIIGRQHADAANYQDYLSRAVDHLHRAKAILDADLRPG